MYQYKFLRQIMIQQVFSPNVCHREILIKYQSITNLFLDWFNSISHIYTLPKKSQKYVFFLPAISLIVPFWTFTGMKIINMFLVNGVHQFIIMWVTCDKLYWFSPVLGTHFSPTNKIDLHDITKILLKVAFNIIHLSIYLN